MSKRIAFFLLLFACSFLISGCSQDPADWQPGDKDQIKKLVSEISDARTNKAKLSDLFSEEALPDRTWLKQTKGMSFVVADVVLEDGPAKATIDIENHFGEVQKTVTWTCERSGDGWQITDASLD